VNIATPVEVELEAPTVEVGRWHDQNIDALAAPQEHLHDEEKDHFIQRNGVEFAGTHLLLDLYDASHLDNIEHIEQAMRDIVTSRY
jgi:S-adenosylmethionine decarboxylase